MRKAILLYIPVVHNGYVQLIRKHQPADIFLISIDKLKDIDLEIGDRMSRNIAARNMGDVINDLRHTFPEVSVGLFTDTKTIIEKYDQVVMPNEDISHVLKEKFYLIETVFDSWFLRWDWTKTQIKKNVVGNFSVTQEEKHRFFMAMAVKQSEESSDWWRQVGAVIPYEEGKALTSFNLHLPTPSEPYTYGDVRLNMNPGEKPEVCTAIHAEQRIIGDAAKKGISLNDKTMYVTTFPCPVCAKLIAVSGIRQLFFKDGYSTLDASDVLIQAGIEIAQVK